VLRALAAFAGACLLAFRDPVRVGRLDTARLERRPLPPPEPPLPCGARSPADFVELLFLTPRPRWLAPRARCRLVPPPLPLVRVPLLFFDWAIITLRWSFNSLAGAPSARIAAHSAETARRPGIRGFLPATSDPNLVATALNIFSFARGWGLRARFALGMFCLACSHTDESRVGP
jgi:hypothetical protein